MKPTRLAVVTLVLAVSPLVVLPSLSAGSPAQAAAALVLPEETRLAFTDERDQLQSVALTRTPDALTITGGSVGEFLPTGVGSSDDPVHVGELADSGEGLQAFVSTEDSDEGEVYLTRRREGTTRVTCDRGIETHPVVGPGESVFYASNADGDWDIYLAVGELGSEDCADWRSVNLTPDLPGDQLWPTYALVADETGRQQLVFSSARAGELPDLFTMAARASEEDLQDIERWTDPSPLTESPGVAETQPALDPRATGRLAFTSTVDRADGSIRLMSVSVPNVTADPWGVVSRRQSSEPAWGTNSGTGTAGQSLLAFTTREDDPYGDIGVAAVNADGKLVRYATVTGMPEMTESHPAFLDTFGPEDHGGELVYTARTQRARVQAEERRVLDADVSDVLLDGTLRRRLIDEADDVRADEAGPDYSPDGSRIAFSSAADYSSGGGADREIWIANADGTEPQPLGDLTEHRFGDIDRDPVWSPDGTRIAFVREIHQDELGHFEPVVIVVDLDPDDEAERLVTITPPPLFDAPDDTYDRHTWEDTDPDWSPDGQRLVLRRSMTFVPPPPDSGPIFRPAPGWATASVRPAARGGAYATPDDALWVVPVQESAVGVPVRFCSDVSIRSAASRCVTAPGRHPAWAPDGASLAFSYRGVLAVAPIATDTATAFEIGQPRLLTAPAVAGEPTEAGTLVSRADDPTWAPDSTEIAFTAQPIGQPDQAGIYAIRPDGKGLRVVTDGRGPESEPSYQRLIRADLRVSVAVTGSPASVGAPLTATYTLTNLGPHPAEDVDLTTALGPGAVLATAATATSPPLVDCRLDGTGCTAPTLAVDETVTYVVTFSHPAALLAAATGTVTSTTVDSAPADNTAQAPYEVVATLAPRADVGVRVTLDEPLGYVGGQRVATVTVRNRGPQTASAVSLQGTWLGGLVVAAPAPVEAPDLPAPECLPAGDSCTLGDLAPGAVRSFRVVLSTLTEMTGTITARVATTTLDPVARNNTATVLLEVVQPTIRLVPAVARPGQVVLAYGENMPPGSAVQLQWDAGLVIDQGPIIVADDGTARTSILLVRRDFLGTRILTASSDAGEFGAVTGDLLVTLRTMTAPEMIGRG